MFCHWDESRADIKEREAGRLAGRQAHARTHTLTQASVSVYECDLEDANSSTLSIVQQSHNHRLSTPRRCKIHHPVTSSRI